MRGAMHWNKASGSYLDIEQHLLRDANLSYLDPANNEVSDSFLRGFVPVGFAFSNGYHRNIAPMRVDCLIISGIGMNWEGDDLNYNNVDLVDHKQGRNPFKEWTHFWSRPLAFCRTSHPSSCVPCGHQWWWWWWSRSNKYSRQVVVSQCPCCCCSTAHTRGESRTGSPFLPSYNSPYTWKYKRSLYLLNGKIGNVIIFAIKYFKTLEN